MAGVASEPFGLDSNYYYTELKNEWPKLYDMRNQKFFEGVIDQPSDIDFFLDFIDTPTAISEFSIQNIGRRTTTLVDDSINCIFEPDSPDIVIIEAGSENADSIDEIKKELYQYTNYNEQISLTTLPIYYLEPNVRITVRDNQSGIYGDYMVKSISLPLDINGTMSLSCTRALERI